MTLLQKLADLFELAFLWREADKNSFASRSMESFRHFICGFDNWICCGTREMDTNSLLLCYFIEKL